MSSTSPVHDFAKVAVFEYVPTCLHDNLHLVYLI